MTDRSHWIGVVSRKHVLLGVQGGSVQLNHGKREPLQRPCPGDGVALYSPRTAWPDGDLLQAFTALCVVTGGEPYHAETADDFVPWRRDAACLPCSDAPIKPAGVAVRPGSSDGVA